MPRAARICGCDLNHDLSQAGFRLRPCSHARGARARARPRALARARPRALARACALAHLLARALSRASAGACAYVCARARMCVRVRLRMRMCVRVPADALRARADDAFTRLLHRAARRQPH
eukprot:4188703-Pleurochrysis_carterae.AAC.1